MRTVKIATWIIGSTVALVVLVAVVVATLFGDEIKNLAIEEINKKIDTKIDVGEIEFSLLKSFPNATLSFQDAIIYSTPSFKKTDFKQLDTDTLLIANQITLQLNIRSLLKNQVSIQRINIKKGKLSLLIDKKGMGNYQFWETGNGDTADSLKIDLNLMKLKDIELVFVQQQQDILFHSHIHELTLSGKFSDDEFSLETQADIWIEKFKVGGTSFYASRSANLSVNFDVKDNVYTVSQGNININKLHFSLAGNLDFSASHSIDLNIRGNNLDIQSLLSLLPSNAGLNTKDIKSDGRFYFDTHIHGTFSNSEAPAINANFGIKDGVITNKKSGLKIDRLIVEGSYSNGTQRNINSSLLNLKRFSFNLGAKGEFAGKGSITNFNRPSIKLNTTLNLDLGKLFELFSFNEIEHITGLMSGNINLQGVIAEGFSSSAINYKNLNLTGNLELNNASLKTKELAHEITGLSGSVLLEDNYAKLRNIKTYYGNTKLEIHATLPDPMEQLVSKSGNFRAWGKIYSPKIKVEDLLTNADSDKSDFYIPDSINIEMNFITDTLQYDRFQGKNFSTIFKHKDKNITLTQIKMKTLNGELGGNANLEMNSQHNLHLYGDADLKEIDIHELLYSFQNFGQEFLTDDHVTGDITGKVFFDTEWTPKFDLVPKSLMVESSVEISNGELYDFKPMMALSDFIKVDDLKHIRFSNLKNDIVIQNEQVYIPKMDINSSAIDLEISGIHSFDQQISYDITVLLSDLLSRKLNKKQEEEWEIEKDPEGMVTLFLTIEGSVDDFNVKYNFDNAKAELKKNIRDEKQKVKSILRDELGLFKKDSTLKKKPNEKKPKVEVIWDEDDQ